MDKQEREMPASNPSQDADFYFMRRMIFVIVLVALIAIGGITVASFFAGSTTGPIVGIVGCCLLLILLWLTWINHLFLPRIIGPLLSFSAGFYMAVTNYGIRDRNIFCAFVTIVLAGLFLGRMGIVVFGGLTILGIIGMTYAEINGVLVTPFSAYTTLTDAIIINVHLALACIIYYMSINNLTDSLKRMRRSEAALSENNHELETIRQGLEAQVVERTRNLETAHREIESANQALQAQMWQISGLAQLGDAMRGEQDLLTLSANVLQHLCRYVDAAIGALYVLSDDILWQTGSYAYPLPSTTLIAFKLGESLVGQVAQDQCPLQLDVVPAGYLTVTSALGEAAPRHLMILPFLFEGQVVGVVEIGSLIHFTPAQLDFLQAAMENVAIAFNTAQARARINALHVATPSKQLN